MKREKLFISIVVLLLLTCLIAGTGYVVLNQEQQDPFYVGVTYCGNSVQEAKELIDQVKDCTNLFILQSGLLQYDVAAMEEIGDYVITSNLSYAVYGGTRNMVVSNTWLNSAKIRWGEQFIGVYYNDEVGGYMLDKNVFLETTQQITNITTAIPKIEKTEEGTIIIYNYNTNQNDNQTPIVTTTYWPDGKIVTENSNELITYYPNGTITIFEKRNNNFYTTQQQNITKYPNQIQPYVKLLEQNPVQTYDDAANAYVNMNKNLLEEINNTQLNENQITVFTSDYGLYWWDYQSGYDLVLAEIAWNNSLTQEIALSRGAANMQNKEWGVIITWKYTHPPYLTSGAEMYQQMKTSYEAGAQYVIIFNYSEDPQNHNTLQDEHLQALKHFWNGIVQNSDIIHGSIKAEAVLVLPQNYGWGMRNSNDTIWGIWSTDDVSQEIWSQMQHKTDQYGLKMDIVFEDPNYLVMWKYNQIYYWSEK
ncbi:MAG: hypothetical protein FWH37_03355 [Candidatus Bathyarchaeota archaeon]|nr:hypothetical protein [Candidatus Termiticorpusculum sp.]